MKTELLSHLGGPTENLGRLGGNNSTNHRGEPTPIPRKSRGRPESPPPSTVALSAKPRDSDRSARWLSPRSRLDSLSRWRHGFESRWGYSRESPAIAGDPKKPDQVNPDRPAENPAKIPRQPKSGAFLGPDLGVQSGQSSQRMLCRASPEASLARPRQRQWRRQEVVRQAGLEPRSADRRLGENQVRCSSAVGALVLAVSEHFVESIGDLAVAIVCSALVANCCCWCREFVGGGIACDLSRLADHGST